ncbi:WxL domain-containing protein [Enterococcus casseliflavus]|uniref:WxL domain-containing protein n=1 Tax=Enterococcus sp. 8E11_MSG4843 TaxID=1834190 RepID=UPI000B3EB781|nr:WxL domain-containing protein [Enterococcus sp. 8E11_MSG4843]MBO1097615.1 WxL domain-containing protein [Enterococcus casseliflavus]MBO1143431.1 WxL domain-containing protein [Enterococcus casseliflavus]OUZ33904.1 hypothetical protein A5885_001619 [Enterococcus sp. 8E11_MSG4843]
MKGKLQKSWVLSSIVLLGLTTMLPSVNMVLADTVNETKNTETQDVTLPYDNLLEAPTSESSDTHQKPTVEEQPTFSLEKEQMVGTIGETTEVVILVDRPTKQVQVTIPQELTVQKDELSGGLEATQMTETEWWFSADERTKFTIPVSSQTAGEFSIRVEDELDGTIAFEEAADDEGNDESVLTDDEDNTSDPEDSVIQEVQDEEETPTQETEDITPATTSNVSTWAQFRTAINTASVTEINVLEDISGNTSLNSITRNLTINGNGYTIDTQSQVFQVTGANRTMTLRNFILINQSSKIRTGGTNFTLRLSDVDFIGSNSVIASTIQNPRSNVIFDGGTTIIRSTNSGSAFQGTTSVLVTNNASVFSSGMLVGRLVDDSAASHNLTSMIIDEGSHLTIESEGGAARLRYIEVNGTANFSANTSSVLETNPKGTVPLIIKLGEKSQVKFEQRESSTTPLFTLLNNVNLEMEIASGAQFDMLNSQGGPIFNNSRSNTVQLSTENLAVWNRGRTSSTPSQNFEKIEARLTGANAATITSTNHNVFRATYPRQGLNGYSRISSSGIAGENPVDPLEPDTEIDPENPPVIPENQGNFRLDFVSQFTFGNHERNMFEEETYYALPQYGLDSNGEVIESEPKPNFVQITDNRADADGWQLSVTQREQFKTETGNELSGASLQLKNRQLVADHDGQQPQEATTEATIVLEPGAKQPLLTSSTGEGKGTWIYRFGDGASSDQSVALVVPKETIPEATTYQTKLDWELQAIPGNE